MARSISEICAAIDAFRPIDGEWLPLDDLIAEALDHAEAPSAFRSLIEVFSRFPDEDGAGVFWSIIHGLEAFPNYEPVLLDAVRESPTELSLTKVSRILSAGQRHVGDVDLVGLLRSISENQAYSHALRSAASRFVDLHSA